MTNFLFGRPWPGLLVWVLLYISDYALTIACARLYRAGANEKFAFEGSYELTPEFQRDIDALKPISPRFLAYAVLYAVLLGTLWFLCDAISLPELYSFALGSLIGVQLTIHTRHLRNFHLFRAMRKSDDVRGRIEYSRSLLLRTSSAEMSAFAGLFLVLFAFTGSWFILGGVTGCLSLAINHRRLVRRLPASPAAAAESKQETAEAP